MRSVLKSIFLIAGLFLTATAAHAQSCLLPANASVAQINTVMGYAGAGTCTGTTNNQDVVFQAGTSTISSTIGIPCNSNVTIEGPAIALLANPTAILNGASLNPGVGYIFSASGGNCTGITIKNLWFENALATYFGYNSSGITVTNNKVTAIPDVYTGAYPNCCGGDPVFYLDGYTNSSTTGSGSSQTLGSLDQNITFTYNQIGDNSSCPNSFANYPANSGCTAIFDNTGECLNCTFEYNGFVHMDEGIKFAGSLYQLGATNSVCVNCKLEYNYFVATHRIAIEHQKSAPLFPTLVYHNALLADGGIPNAGTLNFSMACCGNMFYQVSQTGGINPTLIMIDNLMITTPAAGGATPYGFEFWGQGSQATNNLIEGMMNNGITWNTNANSGAAINYNYLCWSAGFTGGFITQEETYNSATPQQIGNVTSTSCTTTTSIAPAISPTPSGTYTSPVTVTLSIPAQSATSYNQGTNQSIYYTTNGTTPTVSSTRYTAPFPVSPGTTVNAISQWGVPPQPTSWPAGYGFVPSAVKSAFYPSGGAAPTLAGIALTLTGGGNSVAVGKSIQAIATCSYTGTFVGTTNCTTTDPYGNVAGTWTSSTPAFASVSTGGSISGLSAGNTNITAKVGTFTSNPFTVTVTAAATMLTSISLSAAATVGVGQAAPVMATCHYTGGVTTNCTTTDSFGNVAGSWTSAVPADATISSAGVLTGVNTTACSSGTWTKSAVASGATVSSGALATGSLTVPSGNNLVAVAVTAFMTSPGPGYSPSLSSVKDQAGNFYAWSPSSPAILSVGYSGEPQAVWMFYKVNAPSGATTITASGIDATSTLYTITAVAFSTSSTGCGAAFDRDAIAATTAATATPITTPTITPSVTGELLYSEAIPDTGLSGANSPWTVANSLVPQGQVDAYVLSSASGTVANNFTTFNTPDEWAAAIEAFGLPNTSGSNGATTVTAQVGGLSSLPLSIAVTSSSPPAATLTGVAIACGGAATVQVGATLTCAATCAYSDTTTTNCTTTDAHGDLASNWQSSAPGVAAVSGVGVASGVIAGSTNLTVQAGATTASTNSQATLTGWTLCTLTSCAGGGSPGGTNSPASTSQTIGNATPSLSGSSMLLSQTTLTTSTQTNVLWTYTGSSCNTCRNFFADFYVYPQNTTAASSLEYDMFNFDTADTLDFMVGGQCLFSSGVWQIANQTSGWTSTGVSCTALKTANTWHHVQIAAHASNATISYDSVTIDGVVGSIAMTLPTTALPGGYTSHTGYQFQIDVGPTTAAQTVDEYLDQANFYASVGTYTSPTFGLTVAAAPPASTVLGNDQFNVAGSTYPGTINLVYVKTGTAGGYNVASCSFYLPTGYTYTTGSKWDCGLIPAPTATTQATSWLCHATYTTLGTVADIGWHTLGLGSGCGTLAASTGEWVGVATNENGPIGEGFWNCGNLTAGCTGTAPTQGNGTYPYRYSIANYGTYTGLPTTTNATGTNPAYQGSQYVTLSSPLPTLTGGYLGNPGPTTTLSINGSVQFYAYCQYSDGSTQPCYPTPSSYGDTATGWTSSTPADVTIQGPGGSHPGLATGVAVGSSNITATLSGGGTGTATSTAWILAVSSTPQPYPPTSPKALTSR